MIGPPLLRPILSGYILDPRGVHGPRHWARVLETGLRLAERTGADLRVVTLFALFHDARRRNDGRDPRHGRRGAELARRLRHGRIDLDDDAFALLELACVHHTDGTTEGDVTVRTCWDADRLDLWRVGITPANHRLCTAAAREPEIQAWAMGRSLADHRPACVAEWLAAARER